MLTLFSTPKPFRGHADVIQRNALTSWKLLHPDAEIILFGDDYGSAETCRDLGLRHEPFVLRNENGTKYLNYIFDQASHLSRHPFLCYANCDIMLGPDFLEALKVVSSLKSQFLMIGQRWDTDILEPWDFSNAAWHSRLTQLARRKGKRKGPSWLDYFCFHRDLYHQQMHPFLIGRHGWDPWLTYFACTSNVPVIDITRSVTAVHQNHDYEYLKRGGARTGAAGEVDYNLSLGESTIWRYYCSYSATHTLVFGRLKSNYLSRCGPLRARLNCAVQAGWFGFLNLSRPIRHRLGLRQGPVSKVL